VLVVAENCDRAIPHGLRQRSTHLQTNLGQTPAPSLTASACSRPAVQFALGAASDGQSIHRAVR
jgi:hypothetical protein